MLYRLRSDGDEITSLMAKRKQTKFESKIKKINNNDNDELKKKRRE